MYARLGGSRRAGRATALTTAIAGVIAAGLVLAGCSSGSSSDAGKGHQGGSTATSGGSSSGGSSSGGSASPAGPKSKVTVSITPSGPTHVSPLSPIKVTASDGTLQTVSVTRPGVSVTGTFNATKTAWQSNEVLGYGKTYRVSVAAVDSAGVVARRASPVTVINPVTAYPSVFPLPGSGSVGVGLPLSVIFDHAPANQVAAQKALTVTTSPAQPGAWYWISPTEVHYRPATYWKAGTKITLQAKLYGIDLGNGIYGDSDRTVQYTVHDAWIAKANGTSEQMQIFDNGALVQTMPVSMGRDALPTHVGTHVISAKAQNYLMKSCSYGLCGAGSYTSLEHWTERISNDGEFVHENPNTVGSQGHANVSHGCINLSEASAIWFYNHLGVGDVVEVYNSGGKTLPLDDRYGDWAVPWSEWQAGNATSG